MEKEKIIQIATNTDETYFLTDRGRILMHYYYGNPSSEERWVDITPNLEEIKK